MNIGSGWGGDGVGVRRGGQKYPQLLHVIETRGSSIHVHYSTNLALLPNCDVLLLKTKLKDKSMR